jgi:hypothetical protein
MQDIIAVTGRVLDAMMEDSELVLVVHVGDIRAGDGGPVKGWQGKLLGEGQEFPRFVGDAALGKGLRLGSDVQIQARPDGARWRLTSVN